LEQRNGKIWSLDLEVGLGRNDTKASAPFAPVNQDDIIEEQQDGQWVLIEETIRRRSSGRLLFGRISQGEFWTRMPAGRIQYKECL
jgi:hypothetical protein